MSNLLIIIHSYMFYNHVFWITLVLIFCSALNINTYLEYYGDNKILKRSIGVMGSFGIIAGSVTFILLSIEYNSWWIIGGIGASLLLIGVFSDLFRSKIKNVLGIVNLLFIPLIWWFGSKFNTIHSFDWFYDMIGSVHGFFA